VPDPIDPAAVPDFASLERLSEHLGGKVAGAKWLMENHGLESELTCIALDNVIRTALTVAVEAAEVGLTGAEGDEERRGTMATLVVATRAADIARASVHQPLRDSASTRIELSAELLEQAMELL